MEFNSSIYGTERSNSWDSFSNVTITLKNSAIDCFRIVISFPKNTLDPRLLSVVSIFSPSLTRTATVQCLR